MFKLLKECKGAKKTEMVGFTSFNANFDEQQMLYAFKLFSETQFKNLIKESIFKQVYFIYGCFITVL